LWDSFQFSKIQTFPFALPADIALLPLKSHISSDLLTAFALLLAMACLAEAKKSNDEILKLLKNVLVKDIGVSKAEKSENVAFAVEKAHLHVRTFCQKSSDANRTFLHFRGSRTFSRIIPLGIVANQRFASELFHYEPDKKYARGNGP
jgi:hypothetical protein